ncbi:MAG: lysylphosphatidylglycerol synthase domain-containing protein [bacterium]
MLSKRASKNLLKFLVFILSLVLLYFLLSYIGFDRVGDVLLKVGLPGAIVLVVLGILENSTDARALYHALPEKIPYIKVLPSNSSGSLTNLIIPWEAGEVVKIGFLKKRAGTSSAIQGIVLWNYIHKLSKPFAIITILFFSLIVGYDYEINYFFIVLAASVISFAPYLGMRFLLKLNLSVKAVKLLKLLRKSDTETLIAKAEEMDRSLKKFRKERPKDYWATFAIQFIARLISWITFVACSYFAGFEYSLSTLSLAFCAVSLSAYVASFIPAKVGVTEGTGFLIFSFLGLDGGIGLLITFILRVKAIVSLSLISFLNFVVK